MKYKTIHACLHRPRRMPAWPMALLTTALLTTGCGEAFDYHPYDGHYHGRKHINAENMAIIEERCAVSDTLHVVFMGDTQGWYNDTRDMVRHINRRTDVDFVIHGGDYTNFGNTRDFLWQRDLLEQLDVPYVGLIGNHDCIGTDAQVYESMFGPANFSFIAAGVKFVCLNTNAMEYDYSEPVPDFDFMRREQTARADSFTSTVVCMHSPPYNEQFNNNAAPYFAEQVRAFPGVLFCMAAHVHELREEMPFGDGITYYTSDCAHHRNYLLFTITKNSYHREVIYF